MKELEVIKQEILQDGNIDASEVRDLETIIFADGKIDLEEAELLFKLNDAVSGMSNTAEWEDLFIRAIASFILSDEASTNTIDEQEAEWLFNRLSGDGKIDDIERNLLLYLEKVSNNFPAILSQLLK